MEIDKCLSCVHHHYTNMEDMVVACTHYDGEVFKIHTSKFGRLTVNCPMIRECDSCGQTRRCREMIEEGKRDCYICEECDLL